MNLRKAIILSQSGLVLLTCLSAFSQPTYERKIDWSIPEKVNTRFKAANIWKNYDVSDALNPFYLRGDFDGDGIPDYAVLVVNKKTGKRGIAVVNGFKKRVDIVGASGASVWCGPKKEGYAFDDFDWVDFWQVQRKIKLDPDEFNQFPGSMRGEAIDVETESAGGLIYWDGSRYRCFITGD